MKKKRALYNLIVGMGSKFVLMVLGFIIPKIFIENYGSDVNGLLSSIGQVFAYLNLVEAGIVLLQHKHYIRQWQRMTGMRLVQL